MNLSFIILSTFYSLFFHAEELSESHYYLDQNHIVATFEIDQEELRHYRMLMNCKKNNLLDLCAGDYILEHTQLTVNGSNVTFELEGSSVYNGHTILNFKSKKTYDNITSIEVQNRCFYEVNPNFKNRVRIEFNTLNKSFLLQKGNEMIALF